MHRISISVYACQFMSSCLLRVFCCYVGACIDMTPSPVLVAGGGGEPGPGIRSLLCQWSVLCSPPLSRVLTLAPATPSHRAAALSPPDGVASDGSSDVNTREQDTPAATSDMDPLYLLNNMISTSLWMQIHICNFHSYRNCT